MKHFAQLAIFIGIAIIAADTGLCAESNTTIINFGTESRDIGNLGPITESGYQYNPIGNSWQLISSSLGGFPGDGNALVTFWGIQPALGNTITFERLDHGQFYWQSLEIEGRLDNQRNDVVLATGFQNGVQVASQILQSSNAVWRVETTQPTFANPIDTLRFEVVELNGATLMFDNMVFVSVPEPSGGMLLGFAGIIWGLRRAKGKTTRSTKPKAANRVII